MTLVTSGNSRAAATPVIQVTSVVAAMSVVAVTSVTTAKSVDSGAVRFGDQNRERVVLEAPFLFLKIPVDRVDSDLKFFALISPASACPPPAYS
jgi:hypothetical protein